MWGVKLAPPRRYTISTALAIRQITVRRFEYETNCSNFDQPGSGIFLAPAAAGAGRHRRRQRSSSTASSETASAAQTKTEEQLLAEENDILTANDELWEKVFASMDKNVTQTESTPPL